jgi:hypothetical protein
VTIEIASGGKLHIGGFIGDGIGDGEFCIGVYLGDELGVIVGEQHFRFGVLIGDGFSVVIIKDRRSGIVDGLGLGIVAALFMGLGLASLSVLASSSIWNFVVTVGVGCASSVAVGVLCVIVRGGWRVHDVGVGVNIYMYRL